MTGTTSGPKGFTVVDRRASAMDDAAVAEAGATEPGSSKPAYVQQLEGLLVEKERKLREMAAEIGAAQERTRRESVREVERSRRVILVELLEVLDALDRALDASKEAGADEPSGLAEGVALVRDLLAQKLTAFGVARIEARGARFDPARHEAQAVVPVEDPDLDGSVVDVFREGYAIGPDVLRPAGVAVGRVG